MKTFFVSNLDFENIQQRYATDTKVRVTNVLDFELASFTYQALNEGIAYDNAMFINGNNVSIKKDEWKALSDEQRQQIYFGLMENAAKGSGFSYGRKAINESESNRVLRDFYVALNSESVLEKIRQITSIDDINCASMQATQFLPGQFLTRHKDDVKEEGRKVAYVFNLSPEWHPDWGGILQFYTENGDTKESWTPSFNTLSLFDVSHIHSVTYIAPFSKKARLSLSGWFSVK